MATRLRGLFPSQTSSYEGKEENLEVIIQLPGAIKVPSRQISWGGVVKSAEGKDANRREPQYQFSNKRTFY